MLCKAILRRDQIFRAAILNGNLELALEVERDWARLMR